MSGADKDIILQAVSLLENVDEEDHAHTLETLIHEYNAPDNNYELLDSIECDKFKKELEAIDKKSAKKKGQSNTLTLMTHQLQVSMWTQSSPEPE